MIENSNEISHNSKIILASIEAVEKSDFYSFYDKYENNIINCLLENASKLKEEFLKAFDEYINKIKASFLSQLEINDFLSLKEDISDVKAKVEKILQEKNTIENIYNLYSYSKDKFNKSVIKKIEQLNEKYLGLSFKINCINESIKLIEGNLNKYFACYDFVNFIPFKTGKLIPLDISKFIYKENQKSNLCEFEDLQDENLTEEDIKFSENLTNNSNLYIAKVDEITLMKMSRINKISKHFDSIDTEITSIKDLMTNAINEMNKKIEEQKYLSEINDLIENAQKITKSKINFTERKKNENELKKIIQKIHKKEKYIDEKYNECCFESKILDVVLSNVCDCITIHLNTKYDFITKADQIKQFCDFNKEITMSNSKIELWNKFNEIKEENDLKKIMTSSYLDNEKKEFSTGNNVLLDEIIIKKIDTILENTSFIKGIWIDDFQGNIRLKKSEKEFLFSECKCSKAKLLYQASIQGDTMIDFKRCVPKQEGEKKMIILMETQDEVIFGGIIGEKESSVFSLANKKLYKLDTTKYCWEIGVSPDKVLTLGEDGIIIYNNFLKREDNSNINIMFFCNETSEIDMNEYLANTKNFQVKELEVFELQ